MASLSFLLAWLNMMMARSILLVDHVQFAAGPGSVYHLGQLQFTADDAQAAAEHGNFAAGRVQFAAGLVYHDDGQVHFAAEPGSVC